MKWLVVAKELRGLPGLFHHRIEVQGLYAIEEYELLTPEQSAMFPDNRTVPEDQQIYFINYTYPTCPEDVLFIKPYEPELPVYKLGPETLERFQELQRYEQHVRWLINQQERDARKAARAAAGEPEPVYHHCSRMRAHFGER